MAKDLKSILQGVKKSTITPGSIGKDPGVDYMPKAPAEQDFVAKHKTEKFEDRVGNGDDVYKGKTKQDKHQKQDPKVYEDIDIEEAARGTKHAIHLSYDDVSGKGRASKNVTLHAPDKERAKSYAQSDAEKHGHKNVTVHRVKSVAEGSECNTSKAGTSCPIHGLNDCSGMTGNKKLLLDKKTMKEEIEQVDEVLTKKTPVSRVISDFMHSKNQKFKGKSPKERQQMALGAFYGMHPEKSRNEEIEQVDELELKTYMNYTDAAMKKSREKGQSPQSQYNRGVGINRAAELYLKKKNKPEVKEDAAEPMLEGGKKSKSQKENGPIYPSGQVPNRTMDTKSDTGQSI